jgi:hypothetical protein
MGETSELYDGRLERREPGAWGEEPTAWKLGVEVRDRRGWCAWYGKDLSWRNEGDCLENGLGENPEKPV